MKLLQTLMAASMMVAVMAADDEESIFRGSTPL